MENNHKLNTKRKAKELNIQIGERCRQARDASGYTQEQLAERHRDTGTDR